MQTPRRHRFDRTVILLFGLSLLTGILAPAPADATPQFARKHELTCSACHFVPPKLNTDGLDFQASGYRLPERLRREAGSVAGRAGTLPFAAWLTGRFEDKGGDGPNDLFLPKVELISGGTIGDRLSYFAEWRIISLSLNGDGSLGDRAGRFEDLFVQWEFADNHTVKIGQYRSLSQVDVSLRLSASEPQLFGNGLPTGVHDDPRISSLSRFSPSSRSPSIGYLVRSVAGDRPGDGLFHQVTLPFIGELSIPLGPDASEAASFELQGSPKGVFLETFYRLGHKSFGAHAFVDDGAWLLTALGTYDWRNLYITAGFGVDDRDTGESRRRSSLEAEYLLTGRRDLRAASGLRIEDVTNDGTHAAVVPYFALSGPNSVYTMLLQVQYKVQEGNNGFVVDLSALF